MSRLVLREEHGLRALRCNGRLITYEGRITELRHVSAGRWEGIAGDEPFEVIGGRFSGGASNEWFVKWAPGFGDQYLDVTSAAAALRAIENC